MLTRLRPPKVIEGGKVRLGESGNTHAGGGWNQGGGAGCHWAACGLLHLWSFLVVDGGGVL